MLLKLKGELVQIDKFGKLHFKITKDKTRDKLVKHAVDPDFKRPFSKWYFWVNVPKHAGSFENFLYKELRVYVVFKQYCFTPKGQDCLRGYTLNMDKIEEIRP
jgi:hypothetical protein